mmetsp:Transcript_55118/g.118308  ORF Transcript_55118/g.118308 Transcript_55118/m.118308 type:complete len:353 (-) Transcript_55118:516-1574(-)
MVSINEGRHALRAGLHCEVLAELVEEDDASAVLVHLLEVPVHLSLGHLDPTNAEAMRELFLGQPPVVIRISFVKEPEELVEVEEVAEQRLELLLLDPVVPVGSLAMDCGFVRSHQCGLVVQQRVGLYNHLVDLCQGDDVVSVEVNASPHVLQLAVVLHGSLDLDLERVEIGEGLLFDVVGVRRPVSMVPAHDLAALLAGDNVPVEGRIRIRIHAMSDVRAELYEEDLATMVGVNLVELIHGLGLTQAQAQLAHASRELASIDSAVVTSVDDVEHLPELVEPEDVEQKRVELELLDPIVAVAILQDCFLVGAHQRRLVVEPFGPSATRNHLNYHLVDLGKAHNTVAVEVQPLP